MQKAKFSSTCKQISINKRTLIKFYANMSSQIAEYKLLCFDTVTPSNACGSCCFFDFLPGPRKLTSE